MCEFKWKPTLRLGGSGYVGDEGRPPDYVGSLDAGISGAGLSCGIDRWGLTGAAFDLMPSLSIGGLFANDDYAVKDTVYGGAGFRASGGFHIFGMSFGAYTGLDLLSSGLRVPIGGGVGFTFPDVGRFMVNFDTSFNPSVWSEDVRTSIGIGGSLSWTATEFE
ncbi:MAG: hypothetical protein IT381_15015 [Deltaproteobacteria bacterium]|nr:hypothetical protein [Deltaproteobacteria bacterium]